MNAAATMMGDVPRWAVMWLLAGAFFLAGKAAMLRGAGLGGWRLAGFALGWVGMDAAPFRQGPSSLRDVDDDGTNANRGLKPTAAFRDRYAVEKGGGPAEAKGLRRAWFWPVANVLIGVTLLWGVARYFEHPLAAGWVGMVGLILILHFGLFGVLAHVWRALGVPVSPIMRAPIAATSLSEFWGRRWNLAFRDLAHHVVFTPVARCAGHRAATWATFAASGLMHDAVISVPAGAGFGLPTAYFLLQALGLTLERKADRRVRAPVIVKWLRTHAFTVLPAFVLFHPPFVERVMIPFFHVIGALP
jgi:hypothetical protein